MAKTETVHTRVTHEIKEKAENIFMKMGLTTSQAITLFLIASVNHNGLPFELNLPSKEDEDALRLATAIATVDGAAPTQRAKELFLLYKRGVIDLDTYKYAIRKSHEK